MNVANFMSIQLRMDIDQHTKRQSALSNDNDYLRQVQKKNIQHKKCIIFKCCQNRKLLPCSLIIPISAISRQDSRLKYTTKIKKYQI